MSEQYQLPIDGNWTKDDIIAVSNLVDAVLQVYEGGCDQEYLLTTYRLFCEVLPAKSEQKTFDRDFENQTGRSIYQTMKLAQGNARRVVVND
ncbi:hypothetical protein FPFC_020590 [Fructobacillus pseudoficulneus]|uniref:Uncharacterized protein n=1 Tax=Fructobacillus pseudoficulneus TaxID=220714 RepID=A0A3F3GSR2_9LACO|nr:UPF0223 family protein [Fructobacillus pseudoficulneus]GAP02611.1 hypothetical protein FPFC_020590 [Fructobacillus pseudoficulneus]SEH38552.1 Uncharacterized protein YktA, UPF0223 family [Fructobacillus pseudoficulneus]